MKIWVGTLIAVLSFSKVAAAARTPDQVQQLVAPIALYPDALVAQVLAASAYPSEVADADRWMKQHSDLRTDQLAQEVDKQTWDPSVKALTQFPSVLTNLDQNLTWASALGDAFTNQPQDVLAAVQAMRQRAESAGTLTSTPQETVTTEGQSIEIEPTDPEVVYVPAYDPWDVYGAPVMAYPGWVPIEGSYIGGAGVYFGVGFGVGYFGGFGWGWNHWRSDWHDGRVIFNRRPFGFHGGEFAHRRDFHPGGRGFGRGPGFHRDPGFHGGVGFRGDPGFHGGVGFRGDQGVHGGGGFHGDQGFHGGGGFHGDQGFHGGAGGFGAPGRMTNGIPAGGGIAHAPAMGGSSMAGRSSFGGIQGGGGGFHGGAGLQGGSGFHGGGGFQGGGGFHGGGG